MTYSPSIVDRKNTKRAYKKSARNTRGQLKAALSADPAERRRFIRVAADLIGLVECKGRYSTAYLRDISSNGAHLFFVDKLPAGAVRSIVIPRLNQRLICETVWRKGRSIGVQFKERPYEITQKMPVSLRQQMLSAA